VAEEGPALLAVVIAHEVAVPGVHAALHDAFVHGVAHQAVGGELPFGLRRQPVAWQQDTVLHAHVARVAVGVEVLHAVHLLAALVLAGQVAVGGVMVLVDLVGVMLEEALADEDGLVHAIAAPSGVVIGL